MAATRRLARRDPLQGAVVVALLALAVVAWLLTDDRMAGMDAGPGTDLGGLGFFVSAWVVMMAAMMLPSAAPMVATFAEVGRRRGERAAAGPSSVGLFVAGYLAVWSAAGLLAYGLFELGRALDVDAFSWSRGGPYLAGGVLAAAALYQLTPLKHACLRRCRNPLGFLTTSWRDGRVGALVMGAQHGAWCAGCCWALMAALFALGVMSLGWMLLIAALVAGEKLLPWPRAAGVGVAVLLLALAAGVALAPGDVPGLTQPHSHEAGAAMEMMGGP